MMASQIIARGELKQYMNEERCYFLDDDVRKRYFAISCDAHSAAFLKSQLGKTLIIAVEEKEKEPSLTHKLAVALAGA